MKLSSLLKHIKNSNIKLHSRGGKLRVEGDKKYLTPESKKSLKDNKGILLQITDDPFYRLDPFPHLDDHPLWVEVLGTALRLYGDAPEGLYASLHGCRCMGARLNYKDGSLRLSPAIVDGSWWSNESDWKKDREQWLLPYTEQIKRIFHQVETAILKGGRKNE